jgi:photosystem II stability/assembly factor-like uncharacterized protein
MRILTLAVALAGFVCAADAATDDGPQWEPVGPIDTESWKVAVGPTAEGPIFDANGLWSTDGGQTWSLYGGVPLENPWPRGLIADDTNIGGLFVAAEKNDVFYRPGSGKPWRTLSTGSGPGECFVRGAGGVYYGCIWNAVLLSRDGARTWEKLCDAQYPSVVAPSPTMAGHVLVASEGPILITRDGGLTWSSSALIRSQPFRCATTLAYNPAYPSVVYAATPGSDTLFRSNDEGLSWSHVALPAKQQFHDAGGQRAQQIAATEEKPSLVLVASDTGLLVGKEDGTSLQLHRQDGLQNVLIHSVAVNASGTLACAATPKGVYVSRDKGKTWTVSNKGRQPWGITSLGFVPGPAGGLVADSYGTLFTQRRGQPWNTARKGPHWFAVGGKNGAMLFGLTGGWMGRSSDFGVTWQKLADPDIGLNAMNIACGHGSVYIPAFHGPIARSDDDGQTWQHLPIHTPKDSGILAVVADPILRDHIYLVVQFNAFFNVMVGRQHTAPGVRVEVPLILVRSEDAGKTWLNVPASDMPLDQQLQYASKVAGSAARGELLYAKPMVGSQASIASIARSLDGGKTWEAFGDQSMLGGVLCLATEPSDTHVAYAGCYISAGRIGRVFVTKDGGISWEQLGPDLGGIPGDLLVRPGEEPALYAATGTGIYRLPLPPLAPAGSPPKEP